MNRLSGICLFETETLVPPSVYESLISGICLCETEALVYHLSVIFVCVKLKYLCTLVCDICLYETEALVVFGWVKLRHLRTTCLLYFSV